ncbi:MAG TPA: LysM peptidoglycan-binding domain-containing protein [Dehalococcoidia bacterium]|nr:LysM peptidoglycan-binding domain-containing protein [Dehalococcoidia bacterium]
MLVRLGAGVLVLLVLVFLLKGSLFGGDGGGSGGSALRPGSIPTATPDSDPPEPILLGQTQSSGGVGPTTSSGPGGTYVVKSGDTLGGIASSFNVPADQQAAWIAQVLSLNNMTDPRTLAVGVELKLPATTVTTPATPTRTPGAGTTPSSGTPASGAATPTPTKRPTGSGGAYTVVDGDYPFAIAEKFCVENPSEWTAQLLDINNVKANELFVGQVLDLPPGTGPQCTGAGAASTPTKTPTKVP